MDKRINNGGRRANAGRKKAAELKATTSFRVHVDSMQYLRSVKYPVSRAVNLLIKKTAIQLKKSKLKL